MNIMKMQEYFNAAFYNLKNLILLYYFQWKILTGLIK